MAEFKIDITVVESGGKKAPSWNIDTDLDGEITFSKLMEFSKKTLIEISKAVLKEEQDKGFPKTPVTIVDGRFHADINNVLPFGRIEFVRQQPLDKILTLIYESLIERSPVLTGAYRSSHVVTHNGVQIANSMDGLRAWLKSNPEITDRDKIRFVDTQPYAGKLERYGITNEGSNTKYKNSRDRKSKKTVKVKKPNGAYKLAEIKAKRKFGKNVYIQFEFFPGARLGLPRYPNSSHDYVYPTILVFLFKSGLS